MQFRDVKFAIPQIHKEFLLNETLNMKLENASLRGGTIIIDSAHYDKLIRCRFDNCKIISEVPLTIDHSYINDSLEAPENTGRIDKSIPHAFMDSCYFNLCHMPKGDYGNNYINGKPRGSTSTTKMEEPR